jgi:hypothetical protein
MCDMSNYIVDDETLCEAELWLAEMREQALEDAMDDEPCEVRG